MAAIQSILLIITGSISAYKSLGLIRRMRSYGIEVDVVLTNGGAEFITPLSVSSLTERETYTDLFSLKDEVEMGHIQLSRKNDLVLVAPASADIVRKMATGAADDLASTLLLATDKPALVAPAMNHKMWEHPATQRNVTQLIADGVEIISPEAGELACGEVGIGRMASEETILQHIFARSRMDGPLAGYSALVTSGPTYEPIDPVRFVGNRSSGKQGHAIAEALAYAGADVTLISGPTQEPDPAFCHIHKVETAEQMMRACEKAMPADIAICAAAVADWRPDASYEKKLKKSELEGRDIPPLRFIENPDILYAVGQSEQRPRLVVGFAAETNELLENAEAKRQRKGCDWIVANDVSGSRTFGADENTVHLISEAGTESWPTLTKTQVAEKLTEKITSHIKGAHHGTDTHNAA